MPAKTTVKTTSNQLLNLSSEAYNLLAVKSSFPDRIIGFAKGCKVEKFGWKVVIGCYNAGVTIKSCICLTFVLPPTMRPKPDHRIVNNILF